MSTTEVHSFAAADLGASSGRVVLGRLAGGKVTLNEVSRFGNPMERRDGTLRWDADWLTNAVVDGFQKAGELSRLCSLGIDTWGVDYGRLGDSGELLEQPVAYRDSRTRGAPERLFRRLSAERLYSLTGTQLQPFNTIFQLVAASQEAWEHVKHLVLMPDLLAYRLTGAAFCEVTNASTTGMLDPRNRQWSPEVLTALRDGFGLDATSWLPPLVEPGTVIGSTCNDIPVVAVASHDTASAVVALPAVDPDFAYISCGTWSLVGFELDAPIRTEDARKANFTNELGFNGSVRFLKNVMGLWILNECRQEWARQGQQLPLKQLLHDAERCAPLTAVIDCHDARLLPPGDMPRRVRELAAESGQKLSADPARIVRCILDSLALSYRQAIRTGAALAGQSPRIIHIVGGGSQNELLCRLTAAATGLSVVAGPAEGTALGNILVQAVGAGALPNDLATLRQVALHSCQTKTYLPVGEGPDQDAWAAAARQVNLT